MDVKTHVPEVEESKTPKLEMIFSDPDVTFNFYSSYAKDAGFKVHKSSDKRKHGELIWKKFVCSKECCTDKKSELVDGVVKRHRLETRENCGAQLQVRKGKMGEWTVCKFIAEHSHSFISPCRASLLESHCKVSNAKKALTNAYNLERNQMGAFELQAAGSYENTGCSEEDIGSDDGDDDD